MNNINIKSLSAVNGVFFGCYRDFVRKEFNELFKEAENHLNEPEVQGILNGFMDLLSEISGNDKASFEQTIKDTLPLIDDDFDTYDNCIVCYDENLQFCAIEIFPSDNLKLIVDGVDISDFNIEKIKKLSDDFIYEEFKDYISYSKQISFRPSEEDSSKAEIILFGCPNYYKPK